MLNSSHSIISDFSAFAVSVLISLVCFPSYLFLLDQYPDISMFVSELEQFIFIAFVEMYYHSPVTVNEKDGEAYIYVQGSTLLVVPMETDCICSIS